MSLIATIERATEVAGNQTKLAELLGEPRPHISAWKSGQRTCTIDKRIKLAQIAGIDPTYAVLEGLADQLDENDEWQGKAKETLSAILNAFPAPEPTDMKVKTQSKKVNKAWLNDHVNDTYVKLAHKEGFRARAAYKLKEIDEQLGLVKPGHTVVDLGSTPGAWSQYLRRRMSPGGAAAGQLNGTIIALDLLPMEPIEGVTYINGDFREADVLERLEAALDGKVVDVVVSDMAPNLSGIESADAARIAHLVELAVEFACNHLKPDGALVVKLFHGSGYSDLVTLFKQTFKVVKPLKPKASRDKSSETFLVGMGLKKAA
jgi:23S rRNA (uridine2552-2'-O)-methyltransferase